MMNNCGTCRHWENPEGRTDYTQMVEYSDYGVGKDVPSWPEREALIDAGDRKYGLCQVIQMGPYDLNHGPGLPLALTKDGSQYRADLYTRAEFGCVLHENTDEYTASLTVCLCPYVLAHEPHLWTYQPSYDMQLLGRTGVVRRQGTDHRCPGLEGAH